MPLTEQQTRLASTIDQHVKHVLAQGGGDEALLMSLADHMGTFKQLMDMSTSEEMNALCQRYEGFYRFANLLERLGFRVAEKTTSFPIEAFLLMGDNYRADPPLGRVVHGKRKKFDLALEAAGLRDVRRAFYRALAEMCERVLEGQ